MTNQIWTSEFMTCTQSETGLDQRNSDYYFHWEIWLTICKARISVTNVCRKSRFSLLCRRFKLHSKQRSLIVSDTAKLIHSNMFFNRLHSWRLLLSIKLLHKIQAFFNIWSYICLMTLSESACDTMHFLMTWISLFVVVKTFFTLNDVSKTWYQSNLQAFALKSYIAFNVMLLHIEIQFELYCKILSATS